LRSRHSSRSRKVKRFVGAACFFVLGGTAAASLSVARETGPVAAAAAPAADSAVTAERVPVSPAANRQALAQGLIDRPIKSVLNVRAPMTYGDYRWDERGIPAGRIWIRVDPKAQLISVFRGGQEIGTAVMLYGANDVPTPTGKFPILAKLKDHRSATYDAPMPYTLRLTADGVSIHASNVRWGYATHGCIGVPQAFAAKLFAAASVGDEVFIANS
jgi:lipoprotein-anchoring transpeptidase ErfK/SrfK